MEVNPETSKEINDGFENKVKLKFRTNNFDDLKNFYQKNDKIRASDIQLIDEIVSDTERIFMERVDSRKNDYFNIFPYYRKLSNHELKISLRCKYTYIKNIRKRTTIKLCYDFERFYSWTIHADGKKEKVYHTPLKISPELDNTIPTVPTMTEI